YKKYFGYLNTGFKGKEHDVFAYNGGLFKEDEILDVVKIDDELLYQHTFRLSQYDFASEVDVNILGHIFENSLNEIDEIKAQLAGEEIDKSTSKRKKDGVFYTPKYITKYIVENTVGKLCAEKKTELKIVEEDYFTDKKRQQKTKEILLKNLDDYRKWLFLITIVDPTCGSGAFLNEALNFLIKEHNYIDELEAKLLNVPIIYSYHTQSILENNLFGVDINEESVEIAKLSLWLRTAEPNRKLNSLNNNIKCGNSLIDDPAIAGDKAFDWEKEFPQVFARGGFDVVIGNPPYVPTEFISDNDKGYLEKEYKSAFGRINLYPIFYEKGLKILSMDGYLGFITPYTILKNKYYIEARKYILENSKIIEIIDFKDAVVFQDAAVDSIILVLKKEINSNYKFKNISNIRSFETQSYSTETYNILDVIKNKDVSMQMSLNDKFIEKISVGTIPINEIINFSQGIITGSNKKFLTGTPSELTEKIVTGSDFNRYRLVNSNQFIIYDITKLHRPRKRQLFENNKKILLRQTGAYPICTIDTEKLYSLDTVHNGILINEKFRMEYILCILNSRLLRFLYESQINESGKVFAQVKIIYVNPLPIKNIPIESQQPFIEKADSMLSLNQDLQEISGKFQRTLEREFSLKTLSKKLQNYYQLSYADFLQELKKQKVELTLSQKADWEHYFDQEKNKALQIQSQISNTDHEIDQMVYALYRLTEEEIAIVEKA
ncbi:MAG: TaqI-like C-terminal specificity domain-containing protein, partial [Ginsengibacter sp.]